LNPTSLFTVHQPKNKGKQAFYLWNFSCIPPSRWNILYLLLTVGRPDKANNEGTLYPLFGPQLKRPQRLESGACSAVAQSGSGKIMTINQPQAGSPSAIGAVKSRQTCVRAWKLSLEFDSLALISYTRRGKNRAPAAVPIPCLTL
jgi:hypothetical protein